MEKPRVSLLGCGWLGVGLLQALTARNVEVLASTTSVRKLGTLRTLGAEPFLLRLDASLSAGELPSEPGQRKIQEFFSSSTIVILLPPGAMTTPGQYAETLESVLDLWKKTAPHEALAGTSTPKHVEFIMISSTSVFGSNQGQVDDSSEPTPDTDSGQEIRLAELRLLEAVARLRSEGYDTILTIVRAGGLVGIGRHPGLFLAGRKGVRSPRWPVNLVHQADLAHALTNWILRSPRGPARDEIFNAVADSHPSREDFYQRASQSLGLEAPSFSEQTEPVETGKRISGTELFTRTQTPIEFSDWMKALETRKL